MLVLMVRQVMILAMMILMRLKFRQMMYRSSHLCHWKTATDALVTGMFRFSRAFFNVRYRLSLSRGAGIETGSGAVRHFRRISEAGPDLTFLLFPTCSVLFAVRPGIVR
jgi:hypothetical protein